MTDIRFTPEVIQSHRTRAEMAAMVDVATFIAALDDIEQLRAEVERLKAALTDIADIAYDRDGYSGDAEKLGELVDELCEIAINQKPLKLDKFEPPETDAHSLAGQGGG